MSNAVSPLAPVAFAELPAIEGVRLAAAECGIRYQNRPDVLLVEMSEGTQAAGVFTTSLTAAAPVIWCKQILKKKKARALVVNSGNANAFTGKEGMISVKRIATAASITLHTPPETVFIASTGVIGEPLADDKITGALPRIKKGLNENSWEVAARSIMTTDTFMKVATRETTIGGKPVTINGIAKGSGMIAPDMATLLVFVFTDAAIPANVLQKLLAQANDVSFNCTTVDGDTSTNDSLLVFATGKAKHTPVKSAADKHVQNFKKALTDLLTDLAIQVVKDGEGAQKLITIAVKGAASDASAKKAAMAVANSPLVKTAIAGQDANWGRIVMALGKSGEKVVQEKLSISIGGVAVAQKGARVTGYDEAPVGDHMRGKDIRIVADLGIGKGAATVYTCDLTHGYIDINGSYRS